ncbi:GIY-YIG nuclease family protein [Flavobacterium sp. 140616W15]|uniref:GIY-YIG nuclease family protein n=1 Tax=Flavobacterium sp. 140616W15 TaxID=2478552 RepID=UPI000F0C6814|nr:GIY-YIG nuclease family protein [Flavobacterium sp. 140616W15]AYN05687.1 GIY-YIG nuclease family protein [Flavobacterium sp. 140616W15]
MHFVYIIYSPSKETYYIGETSDIQIRIQWHNSGQFKNSHTKIANDWILFYSILCINIEQARKIEKHIKSMKSKTYLLNLKNILKLQKSYYRNTLNQRDLVPIAIGTSPREGAKKTIRNDGLFFCLHHTYSLNAKESARIYAKFAKLDHR